MNRITLTLIVLICYFMQMGAQSFNIEDTEKRLSRAIELKKADKTDEALKVFIAVGKETEQKRSDDERKMYVFSQTSACMCLLDLEQYGECFKLTQQLRNENLSDDDREEVDIMYIKSGYNQALNYMRMDNSADNYKIARNILEEISLVADEDTKQIIMQKIYYSYYFEGAHYEINQNYEKSIALYLKALSGFKLIKDDKNIIITQKAAAGLYAQMFDFNSAKENYLQALALARKCNNESQQIGILRNLWKLGNDVEDVELAHQCSSEIDTLMSNSTDSKNIFDYCIQKGDECQKQGLYSQAEIWYKKVYEITAKNKHNSLISKSWIVNIRLRDLYVAMKRYEDAIVYGQRVIAENNTHGFQYGPYMSKANIYQLLNKKDECYAYLDSISAFIPQIKEPIEYYYIYGSCARIHSAFKDYKTALDEYKKADEILATKYTQSDHNRVALLALIGGMEYRLGNHAAAEEYYTKYVEYTKLIYGENSLNHINSQIYLANAKGFAGNTESGCNDYSNAIRQLKQYMKQRFPLMGEEERKSLWSPITNLFTWMTPYAIRAEAFQSPFTQDCYDALVMSKAFLLESERSIADIIKAKGTAEEKAKYSTLALIKNRIKALDNKPELYKDSIMALSQRYNALEKELISKNKSNLNQTSFMDIDYNTVKQALKKNETLIDFTDYVSESKGRRYAAYVINKTQKYPLLKYLFDERQIDSLGIARADMYYDADYAADVLNLLWEPLKNEVAEGATVYYVPSQLLFQVSLESLPLADGSLLGSHYNFVRLSSARELAARQKHSHKNQAHTAVLYGGLKYDLEPTAMAEESKKYDLGNLMAMHRGIVRGDSIFNELKGSKKEVEKIESILIENKWMVTPYMGKNGTEESFVNMNGKSPRLLHIATHGFYFTPSNAEDVDYLKGYTDAMSLSGLVMSGGNAAWLGKEVPKGVLSGILTANDIARLDLNATDMVVLSACQTGRGKATSEGLYGLQRAFKKAGVGTIVMSLWNVNDMTTSDFMVTFYERLSDKANAWNKRKAFEETKEIIRKKYPDPYHWAAFVMLD